MKILVAHNSYQHPGGEDVVFEQECQLLKRAGHHVVIYRRSNSEISAHSGLRQLELVQKTIWATDTRKEVAELLKQENPDVVHVHNTFVMISPSIYSACYEAGVPVVQTLHNYRLFCPAATFFRDGHVCEDCIEHSLWRAVKHKCYRDSRTATATVALMLAVHRKQETWNHKVSSYITLSQFARSRFIKAGLSADRIVVKPNFVHPDPGAHANHGEYVLFVGRLSTEKRVSTVLAACSRLRDPIPLLVVGDGPERPHLEEESLRRGLDTVTFHGHLSRHEMLRRMQRARFLVFSSESYETFCMSIAESFACGVPVICSRLGAMQEIVEDGRTGLHFTPGDADDLAAKIEWAWHHSEQMTAMGREARLEYESKYTAERNYELLIRIYQTAIADQRQTQRANQ